MLSCIQAIRGSYREVRVEQEPAVPVHRGHGLPHLEHGAEHPGVGARPVQGHEDHPDAVPGAVCAHEAVCSQEQHPSEVSGHCYHKDRFDDQPSKTSCILFFGLI